MTQLILIRGLPGSGKSTIAKALAGYEHLEADMYFMKDGVYQFEAGSLQAAHAWCKQECFDRLKKGQCVVVANTFTQWWEMQPYIDMAHELYLDWAVITARGQFKNTHGVSDAHIERMRQRWEN